MSNAESTATAAASTSATFWPETTTRCVDPVSESVGTLLVPFAVTLKLGGRMAAVGSKVIGRKRPGGELTDENADNLD